MPDIGIALGSDRLVLTRRRDFQWFFDNLDEEDLPIDFPPGELYFELDTGGQHNASQVIRQSGATGGSYQLSFTTRDQSGDPDVAGTTTSLNYNSESPPVRSAVDLVLGAGNTEIHMLYYPQWVVKLTTKGSLDPKIDVNAIDDINKVFKDVFGGLSNIVGIFTFDLVYAPPNLTYTVTQVNGLDESDILGYIVNTVAGAISQALDQLSWVNNVTTDFTITETYAPVREFTIDFLNDLAETEVDKITASTAFLTNTGGNTPRIDVDRVEPGKPRFETWPFTITGPQAGIKVESEIADRILHRTRYQLVFLPEGEPLGGWPVARGRVAVIE